MAQPPVSRTVTQFLVKLNYLDFRPKDPHFDADTPCQNQGIFA